VPQGLSTLRMLWQLQDRTGRKIHELFDLVCGTSTGGILAAALAIRSAPLPECEEIYRCAAAGMRDHSHDELVKRSCCTEV